MPRPTRSSDSSISRACCLVSDKIYPLLFTAARKKQIPRCARNDNPKTFFPARQAARPRRRPLQLYGFGFCGSPLNGGCLRNQAELGGVLEIEFQASAVFRVERKVDVVAQVGFERALRQFQVLRGFVADFAEMRESEIA